MTILPRCLCRLPILPADVSYDEMAQLGSRIQTRMRMLRPVLLPLCAIQLGVSAFFFGVIISCSASTSVSVSHS